MPSQKKHDRIVPDGKESDDADENDNTNEQDETNNTESEDKERQPEATTEEEPSAKEQKDNKEVAAEEGDKPPEFPLDVLTSLDEQLNRPRWVVPVLPKSDLEQLLTAAIKLARAGLDVKSEPCQRFFKDGLSLSFVRVLDDDAVNAWNPEIQMCIFNNTKLLVELCAVKLDQDWFSLLELLARALNPSCKWNYFNQEKASETVEQAEKEDRLNELFARPSEEKSPRGWLCDLLNIFGDSGGFDRLKTRFCSNTNNLTVSVIAAQIRPFSGCIEYLTDQCVQDYILPVVNHTFAFLEGLNDETLKKESSTEAKGDNISSIMKSLRHLTKRVTTEYDIMSLRLKMILRLLKIASFSGKMNALNEINKIIPGHSYHTTIHYHSSYDEEQQQMTSEKMASWIKDHQVLMVVLRDNLHQPQYVEKLEKMLRFCIREKVLSIEDLDAIWASQDGKHEAIVKNIHDLLAKLAWDFSPEQLDHLFKCFQRSWVHAAVKKQRDELLEFIRRLAEDDKDGVMANKVLNMLWTLAKRDDCLPDTLDHALNAHLKILDFSCAQDRDNRKMRWLESCMQELAQGSKWVLPALKHFKDVCNLYPEPPPQFHHSRSSYIYYRPQVLQSIDQNHRILAEVIKNLQEYMDLVQAAKESDPQLNPETYCIDDRFNHYMQVQSRLDFIRFVLKDGNLWLGFAHALSVWKSLAEKPVFPSDREAGLKWFSKLVNDEPDLEADSVKHIFVENVMKLNPTTLTDNGFRCFDRFFRHVNHNEHKLRQWRRTLMTDSLDLMGLNYLWRVILTSQQSIAHKAIELMKDIYTNLTPQLKEQNVPEEFLRICFDRMQKTWVHLVSLKEEEASQDSLENQDGFLQHVTELTRCLGLLKEYCGEVDDSHLEERAFPSHSRSSWGRPIIIRLQYSHNRGVDEFEVPSHANEAMAAVRRHIKQQLKLPNSSHLELTCGADVLMPHEDHKYVAHLAQRDRMVLQVKVVSLGNNTGGASSQESSSDSEKEEGPNLEAEKCLPSVLMSLTVDYTEFLLSIGDFALDHKLPQLRESVRDLLQLIPSDHSKVAEIIELCKEQAKNDKDVALEVLRKKVVEVSPFRQLYNLEIIQSLLMPATELRDNELGDIQMNFIKCSGVELLMEILSNERRLANVDLPTRQSIYMCSVHISRLLLLTEANMRIYRVAALLKSNQPTVDNDTHKAALQLQTATQHYIFPLTDAKLKDTSKRIAQVLHNKLCQIDIKQDVVKQVCSIVWSTEANNMSLTGKVQEIHPAVCDFFSMLRQQDPEVASIFKESFELVSLLVALNPTVLDYLQSREWWSSFVMDSLTRMRNRYLRMAATEQIFVLSTQSSSDPKHLLHLVKLLIAMQEKVATELASTSSEYFRLLGRLLNHAITSNIPLPDLSQILDWELKWIAQVKQLYESDGTYQIDPPLIEGHLNLTVELIHALSPEDRYKIGSEPGKMELIKILIEKFLFPSTVLIQRSQKDSSFVYEERSANAVCSTTEATAAAFKVITALCTGSLPNLKSVYLKLQELFYTSGSDMTLTDWEYYPHMGPRPLKGFVGLRNAGATCYMNAVLQQLYMISDVRQGVLDVDKTCELFDDTNDDDDKPLFGVGPQNRKDSSGDVGDKSPSSPSTSSATEVASSGDARKDSHRRVLMQLQTIFSHLFVSKLQAHTPRGFWRDFRLWGEKVNLREQHDAFEFFNCLVDNVDEGLKSYSSKGLMSSIMGGLFADQKICKGCPHRYCRTEPYMALNVDVRHHQHLFESLDAFVKGDLLEGANAYHCEKCNKKVDTVKRLCIKQLPKVLVIQLKRFDYDWEREMAVKFNDYFEFPREFDMASYTAAHLAKVEGEVIEDDQDDKEKDDSAKENTAESTEYSLRGIVVHSGQASGGHYYSFIRYKQPETGLYKWYKFDDSDVSEWKMDDDEELKSQCFGGEYTGEVYDQDLRRSQFRRQKRWWSAYLLFYERKDYGLVTENQHVTPQLPSKMQCAVQKRNLHFVHHKSHFNHTYFTFIKQVLVANASMIKMQMEQNKVGPLAEESSKLALLCCQLATEFLFNVGFRTKRNLRGPANEWAEPLIVLLQSGQNIREWFANHGLLRYPSRLCEFLLECPATEIRHAFSRLLLTICQESNKDGPYNVDSGLLKEGESPKDLFSKIVVSRLLELLKKEVPHYGRHLQNYFNFFMAYAYRTKMERQQLLRLDVPIQFIGVALDEGPGPPIRTPYADITKLYPTVTNLLCCYDITPLQKSSEEGLAKLTNPFKDQEIQLKLPEAVEEHIFRRPQLIQFTNNYVKKVIDDNCAGEDTVRLLKFICWENWDITVVVLHELLSQLSTCQSIDMRPYTDLLFHISMLEDSWQQKRLIALLKGLDQKMDGMVNIIQEAKTRYHKKAYLAIKFLVNLFHECELAVSILFEDSDLKQLWKYAIKWLKSELERRSYNYPYPNWSPPAQSNELSNGYFLERSNSAVLTLNKAYQILSPDEPEEPQGEATILPGGDPDAGMPSAEAEEHGIERPEAPQPFAPEHQTSVTSSNLDNIDEEDLDVGESSTTSGPLLADRSDSMDTAAD